MANEERFWGNHFSIGSSVYSAHNVFGFKVLELNAGVVAKDGFRVGDMVMFIRENN